MRLIDAEALKEAIEQGEGFSWDSYGKDDLCVRKKYIDNAPTVEPEEVTKLKRENTALEQEMLYCRENWKKAERPQGGTEE